jgi:gas vesicle protein
MGQEPQVIRSEIEQTREHMGDTMDAIGYKTDVKSRARDSVSSKVGAAKDKPGMGGDGAPDADEVKQKARQGARVAQENPLGIAVGAVALGLLAGLLIPVTDKEHEKLGPMADQVKDQAKQTGQEALERGKDVAQSAVQSAAETAKDEGQERADKLKASAQENVQKVGPS